MHTHQNDSLGKIIVAGSLAYDYIMDFPGHFKDHILPDKVHCINLSFLVDKLTKQRGGCAANIGYTLALLGEHPRVVAAAGRDFPEYAAYLQEHGIDVSCVLQVDDEVTATCFCTTDKTDNQIQGFYVGAMKRARDISLKAATTVNTQIVVIAPDDPEAMVRHCREAREAKLRYVYDPSFQVIAMDGPTLWESTCGAHTLILNDYEFAVFSEKIGKTIEEILESVDIVVVTQGEKGSLIHRKSQETLNVAPAKVLAVVDPTGAGDAYRGGFVTGIVRGLPLQICGQIGSISSAYAVEHYGTQNHHYTMQEFVNRYEENFGKIPEGLVAAHSLA
jgi:adenosine kinase